MPLIQLVIVLVVVGVILWLINSYNEERVSNHNSDCSFGCCL